jgi:Ca2+-binding RTX toxin-like protein
LANILTGNSGNNALDGGAGADTLVGGKGDDMYTITSGDTVTAAAGEGTDTIRSDITVAALGTNVENLTLTGTAAFNGTGNALGNTLTGNSANNSLTGGSGADQFIFKHRAQCSDERRHDHRFRRCRRHHCA